jgi:hypothetical protein
MLAALALISKLSPDDVHSDDKPALVRGKVYVAVSMLGGVESSYCLSMDAAQVKEGALLMLGCYQSYMRTLYESFDYGSLAKGSYEKYYYFDSCLQPLGTSTFCLLEMTALQDYITSVSRTSGELGTWARQAFETYDCSRFHSR